MTMKNVDFWDVMACGSRKNRRFGRTYRLHYQGEKNELLVTANVPSLLILFTLMMKAIRSSEISFSP
jgi:hypothetical protein